MKHLFLIVAALLLLGVGSASAELNVVYHLPADNPVDLETTVSFRFNEELDLTARWNVPDAPMAVYVSDPEDSIEFGEVTFEDDNHTVSVDVVLRPETEYCFVVTNARAINGDTLAMPYACSFSTRLQTSATTLAGTVDNHGDPVIGAIVALLAQPPTYQGHREARYATVVTSESGMFLLTGPRAGTYWLVAAWDVNHNGMRDEGEPLAEYDADDDGDADSLVVSGTVMPGLMLEFPTSAAPELPVLRPRSVVLSQNYPNPFNPTTTIAFTLPDTRMATLTVFDMLGREIAVLQNGLLSGGNHTVTFDAQNLPGGLYFYRLDAGDVSVTQKMLLLK